MTRERETAGGWDADREGTSRAHRRSMEIRRHPDSSWAESVRQARQVHMYMSRGAEKECRMSQ